MPEPIDDDATIRLTRPSSPGARQPQLPVDPPRVPSGPSRVSVRPARVPVWALPLGAVPLWAAAASTLLVILAVAGGWLLWPSTPPQTASRTSGPPITTVTPQASARPNAAEPQVAAASPGLAAGPSGARGLQGSPGTAPGQAEFSIGTATEQQILDHVPAMGEPDPVVFRFASNPRILVLDFASLLDQGRMLNRVAALVEKSGLPHDRVMTSFELAAAIQASGDTVETFYYGHDYDAPSLIRFFALADRDNIRLVGEEDRLGRLIRQAGWFEPDAKAALISIPQVGADQHVTRSGRATILHHELSHGEYFTNPAYVAFVHQFWMQTLTAGERDRIRAHLRSVGYDSGLEEVMENEAQAYLMFTDGAEFFTPEMIGMSTTRLTELRTGFFQAMPAGWLRDSLGRTPGVNGTVMDRP
jgi:hypothetical protein